MRRPHCCAADEGLLPVATLATVQHEFLSFSLVSFVGWGWKMQSGEIEVVDQPNAFLESWFPVRDE